MQYIKKSDIFTLMKFALPLGYLLLIIIFNLYFMPTIEKANAKNKQINVSNHENLLDDLFAVSFINDKNGWTCGRWGTVLRTTDGGQNWEKQQSGTVFTLTDIQFIDENLGWAVGDNGTIIHTKDGGNHWEMQKSPVAYYFMGLCFISPAKGWVVGERTHILHTEDGGKSWVVQFNDTDYILKSVSFSDVKNGWAVGEYGFIYHTKNGGLSWEKESGFFGISDKTGKIIGETFLFDVIALNQQCAWAVGGDGYVSKTVDGGATWQSIDTGLSRRHLFCVAASGENLVIGGKGALLASSDNGLTFKTINCSPPITYGYISDIDKCGRLGFVGVGSRGSVYKSNELFLWNKDKGN